MSGQIEFSADNTLKINFLFLSVLIYLLLTALSINDEMLFAGSGSVKLPLFEHSIGLDNFMILMPIFILVFHFYFLIHLKRHFHFLINEKSDYPSFYNLYHLEEKKSNKGIILFLILFSTILFPLSLQTLFFVILLKFQNLYLSFGECIIIFFQIFMVYRFRHSTTFNFSDKLETKRKIALNGFLSLIGLLVLAGFLQLILLFYNNYNSFPFKLHFEINRSTFLWNTDNSNVIIKNRNLRYLKIKNTSIQNFTFYNVNLEKSEIIDDSLVDIDFVKCIGLSDFKRSELINIRFLETQFKNSVIQATEFKNCSFYDCTFKGTLIMEGIVFENTNFRNLHMLNDRFKCEAIRIDNKFKKICNAEDFK